MLCSIRSGAETNHPKTAILDILFLPADIRLLAGSDSTLTLLTVWTSSNILGILFGAVIAAPLLSNESRCCNIICAVTNLQGLIILFEASATSAGDVFDLHIIQAVPFITTKAMLGEFGRVGG